MSRYRTIVADPPWDYSDTGGWPSSPTGRLLPKGAVFEKQRKPLPYASLSVEDIAALPVADLAANDAHLWLWTTNRYLFDARTVAEAWGFRYAQLLVWAKTPMGLGPGGAFAQSAEYILFCRRGAPGQLERIDSVWFNWKRTAKHSAKPDAMLDLVERVSPEPRLELFARRARFGWDYWGDQSLGTAKLTPTATEVA